MYARFGVLTSLYLGNIQPISKFHPSSPKLSGSLLIIHFDSRLWKCSISHYEKIRNSLGLLNKVAYSILNALAFLLMI